MKHEPEHEQYIGKPLSECPDGTKAVVRLDGCEVELVRSIQGGPVTDSAGNSAGCPADTYTVLHILSLGKPRPKTLAEEEPGVVWDDGYGCLWWLAGEGIVASRITPSNNYKADSVGPASHVTIGPGWTRLGPITGIEIGGEVWRGDK